MASKMCIHSHIILSATLRSVCATCRQQWHVTVSKNVFNWTRNLYKSFSFSWCSWWSSFSHTLLLLYSNIFTHQTSNHQWSIMVPIRFRFRWPKQSRLNNNRQINKHKSTIKPNREQSLIMMGSAAEGLVRMKMINVIIGNQRCVAKQERRKNHFNYQQFFDLKVKSIKIAYFYRSACRLFF